MLTTASPGADEEPAYDQPPKLLKGGQPRYPAEPFRKGVQGTVLIEFTVDEKGHVQEPKVLESIPELDSAALDCVTKWRFTPATKAGKPVAAQARAPITFRITGKKDKK